MLEQAQDFLKAQVEAELLPGGLLNGQGLTRVTYAEEDRITAGQFDYIAMSWDGIPKFGWVFGANVAHVNIESNRIDFIIYVKYKGGTKCKEDADRRLQRIIWDRSVTPNKGLIPTLAKLSVKGLNVDGDRWVLIPGSEVRPVNIKGLCVAGKLSVRLKACGIEMK